MNKLVAMVGTSLLYIMLGIALSGLSGCGFHLRGTQTSAIPLAYQQLQLDLPQQASGLREPLTAYLQSLGLALK